MHHLIVGLGNPGEKYEDTRHNTGRMFVDFLHKKEDFSDWEFEKRAVTQFAKGKIGKKSVFLAQPDTFMNKSGNAVTYLSKTKKIKPEYIIVAYDDIDLPFGGLKVSFDRGSGGHRGLDSVIKQLKTRAFVRFRFGIAPHTPSGKIKKPSGEDKVLHFLLGKYKTDDTAALKKVFKKATEALKVLVLEGKEKAMSQFN